MTPCCTTRVAGWVVGEVGPRPSAPTTNPPSPSTNITITGNSVHDNWGEGIVPIAADTVTIQSNKVFNNYSVLIYLTTSRHVKVIGNYLYITDQNYNRPDKGYPATGVL